MIYDCFSFFNEVELLEIRLHELADVVDKFVLVEATKTHANKPKPLYFQENRARFSAFQDKIIHIVVDDLPDVQDAFLLERWQRNAIAQGLTQCRPDDVVMVSDVDEIPRATTVAAISRGLRFDDGFFASLPHTALNSHVAKRIFHRKGLRWRLRKRHPFVLKFKQDQFNYFLNCRPSIPPYWYGTRMLHYRDYSLAEEVRHSGYKIIPNAGWHFSYMGGAERVSQKLQAYSHQEHNKPEFTDPKFIEESINRGTSPLNQEWRLHPVPLDETFPHYLLEHREQFAAWIKPV